MEGKISHNRGVNHVRVIFDRMIKFDVCLRQWGEHHHNEKDATTQSHQQAGQQAITGIQKQTLVLAVSEC